MKTNSDLKFLTDLGKLVQKDQRLKLEKQKLQNQTIEDNQHYLFTTDGSALDKQSSEVESLKFKSKIKHQYPNITRFRLKNAATTRNANKSTLTSNEPS